MRKITLRPFEKLLIFMTIWVYFSLNANYLNFPGSHIFRWVCPGILIILTIVKQGGKIIKPPRILLYITCAVFPSIIFSVYVSTAFIKYISLVVVFYGSYIFFSSLNNTQFLKEHFNILAYILIIYQILNTIFVVLGINYDSGRALGITTNANTLGVYANLSYWAIIYVLQGTKKVYLKIINCLLLMTCVMSVIASGSRTAFVVLVLDILITGFLLFRHSPLILVFVTGCILMIYLFYSGKLTSINILALNRLMEKGGIERTDLWQAAFNLWREHRIFGVGYTVSNFFNPIEPGMAFHNSYISYLVENGIWGCIILGIGIIELLFYIIYSLRKCRNKFEGKLGELTVVCTMLVVLLIAAWSESFLFAVGSTEGFTFWFLLAWLLSYIHKLYHEERVL